MILALDNYKSTLNTIMLKNVSQVLHAQTVRVKHEPQFEYLRHTDSEIMKPIKQDEKGSRGSNAVLK